MRDGEIENTILVADIEPLRSALSSKGITIGFSSWMQTLEETYKYYYDLPENEATKALQFHGLL